MKNSFFAIILSVIFISTLNGQTTYFVKTSGNDADAGTSWGTAFATVQKALSVAVSGDQIWVAAGTYKPSASDQSVSFQLKAGVAIYGGFSGAESTLGERNWETNITILSGDIDGDATLSGNSYHVVKAFPGVSTTAILDGFTVTAGSATDVGGGVFVLVASPTLTNLIITGNSSTSNGGGINNSSGSPVLTNVTFSGNQSSGNGGGMYNSGSASLSNCTFDGNTASNGGGLYNDGSSIPVLKNIAFKNNTASSLGGGFFNNGNTLTPQNILFDDNHANSAGGGFVESGSSTYANITAYGNTSNNGGGFYVFGSGSPSIVNAIFWNNNATTKGDELYGQASGNVTISYSIIDGGIAGSGVLSDGSGSFLDGGNNLGSDPLLDANLELSTGSPAIDAGDNSVVTASTDLNGDTRIINTLVDIGAYEFQTPLPVELISFTALPKQNRVELHWKTATEVNNYGFEVQRSDISSQKSEVGWKKLNFVGGNGTTNALKEYSFTDKSLKAGKYSYRLKQIDNNGKIEYSKEVEVTILQAPKMFSLMQNYPNPFNPTTNVQFSIPALSPNPSPNGSGDGMRVTLKVYDMVGREVATLVNEVKEAGTYEAAFKADKLSSGIYFYTLRASNYVETKKMLLMK